MGALSTWGDFGADILEVVALVGVLWHLFRLRREMGSLLRVVRRIDRKMGVEVFTTSERGSGLGTPG